LCPLVDTDNHGMVTLKRLERQLLLWLDAHLSQLGDFLCKDGFGSGCRVDAVGLDGDDDPTTNLQKETSCVHVSSVVMIIGGKAYR